MTDKASGSKTVDSKDVAEMMERLGLQENGLDDVVFEEQEPPPPESVCWMALARVHTDKPYSQYWFFRNMRVARDLR